MPLNALLLAALLLAGCVPAASRTAGPEATGLPPVPREFRAAWVATVANIDWPSRPGLSAGEQQTELLAILDRAVELRLNAVILQVRPAADALYASELEPWSEYLTGAMGKPPEPFYDPLEFAVTEAHRRGLELHAWFNPYRARHPSARSEISADHISRTDSAVVRRYGRHLWMDPGEPAVQDHSVRVILDVVQRYAVDGVHIDDYFYPYPERDSAGAPIPFPDERSWARYASSGGRLSRDDWRRQNVDQFVERVYREIKRAKPWVKFGVSPFGIWRPGHPPQITTVFDQYGQIYADARKWLANGWVDYFTPQLYWPIAQTAQSYPVLLRWWTEQNAHGRHIWPGNYTSRVVPGGDRPAWPASEILGQIYVTRGQHGATGNVHFSMRALMQNPDSLASRLASEAYAQPALIPASPWLWQRPPPRPHLRRWADPASGAPGLELRPAQGTQPTWWIVRTRRGDHWTLEILPAWQRVRPFAGGEAPDAVAVSGVDRTGNEGAAAFWERAPDSP